jgi:hypothetical protein
MKKGILILTIFLFGSFAYAQKIDESEIPTSVKTKFTSIYPDTKVEKWKKENGNYEARFDKNKTEMSVIIDPNGKLLETETSISISSLPIAIKDYLENNYDGKKIKEITKITYAKGTVFYETEVHETTIYFDSNGTFLRSENKSGGVYITFSDYLNKKLSYKINCKTEKETFRLNESINESYITLLYNKQKIKLYKDSIYGFITCNEPLVRFQDNREYYLSEEGPVWIFYLEIDEISKKEYKPENPYRYSTEKEYYFSTKGDGKLIALTVDNLKQAFLNNPKVQTMVDTQFKNTDIYQYDSSHKMFKLNYLLKQLTSLK